MSGTEFARDKENVAAIMRAKQAAGTSFEPSFPGRAILISLSAEAKKAEAGAAGKK